MIFKATANTAIALNIIFLNCSNVNVLFIIIAPLINLGKLDANHHQRFAFPSLFLIEEKNPCQIDFGKDLFFEIQEYLKTTEPWKENQSVISTEGNWVQSTEYNVVILTFTGAR